MKLTAAAVEKMQPAERRQEIPDSLCVGLYLVVQPTGKKAWQVRYRHAGVHRRMTLGPYPVLSLADARQRARDALAGASEGRDPAGEVKAAKIAANPELAERDKVKKLIEQYGKRHLDGLKSGKVAKRELERHVVSRWGERDIHTITKRDVLDLLDGLADSGRKITANRVRAYLNTFLNWCVDRDVLPMNPATGVKRVVKEVSRDRYLSDDEIRWFWAATGAEPYPWGPLARMLLLTGQRLNEVAQMTEREVRGDIWHLAAARTKNGRAHDVPLTEGMLAILGALEPVKGAPGFLFTTTGETPVSGFNKALHTIQAGMAAAAEKERGEPVEIPHWTFHDLRRTAATTMARLGVPVRVTEAVVNHISGTGGGIVAVYQRHDFADEKRQALEGYGRFVAELVDGKAGNVVRLRGA